MKKKINTLLLIIVFLISAHYPAMNSYTQYRLTQNTTLKYGLHVTNSRASFLQTVLT